MWAHRLAFTCLAGLTLAFGQTGNRRIPVTDASKARDAVREKVQALLAEGWSVTGDTAQRLEAELERNPENLAVRARLLSHYYQRMIPEARVRHLLWLIERHPESELFQYQAAIGGIVDPAADWSKQNQAVDWERAKALWLQHANAVPADARVLANAAQALSQSDPRIALELIQRARSAEPANPEWTKWLAGTYAHAIRRSFGDGKSMWSTASSDAFVRMPLTLPDSLTSEIKREMETSRDAALVGATGNAMVREIRLLREWNAAPTPDMEPTIAFGENLIARAKALDPGGRRLR